MIVPPEIIYHIIHFLPPQEVLQLQAVSKQFHAIVNDPTILRTMYQNAPFPLLPGPFPWQSTRFLKRTLIRSARLARTWTSQPLKIISYREVHTPASRCHWVSERWLIVKKGTELVAHDIDTDSQQTLWESVSVKSWTACSIICARGHFIYLALREGNGGRHDFQVTLLEFRADEDSGHLSGPAVFNVPISCLEGPTYIDVESTNAPFVKISDDLWECDQTHIVIFDIRSRVFYNFPRFTSKIDEVESWPAPASIEVVPTTTHIVVVSYFDSVDDGEQVIQAFIIPFGPAPPNGEISKLWLSHETRLQHGALYFNLSILRDSVVSQADGSTTLMFLHSCDPDPESHWFCTKLSLPRPQQPNVVIRMLLETQNTTLPTGYYRLLTSGERGLTRGLYEVAGRSRKLYKITIGAFEESNFATTTIIDAGDVDDERGTIPILSQIQWFDGIRGRICYTTPDEMRMETVGITLVVTVE